MNVWNEMRVALAEAKEHMRAADDMSIDMARLLVGRLRCVRSTDLLRNLKRELRDFDMTTGKWKP